MRASFTSRFTARIESWSNGFQCGFWILIAGVLMAGQLIIVRFIGDEIGVFQIIFFRALFGLAAITPLLVRNGEVYLRPNRPVLAILCGALAFVATVFFFLAATELPVADITAIHFIRPVFAAVLAALVLREAWRGGRLGAIVAGFVGAAVIIRPGLIEFNVGILYVFCVVIVQSWNPINRKLLSRSEHPDTVAVWNILAVLPLAGISAAFFWITPSWSHIGWMAIIGLLEVANQRVLSRAYMRGDAVVVVALHYTRLPIAALLGLFILGEFPDLWVWLGGAIIVGAAIYLTLAETNYKNS